MPERVQYVRIYSVQSFLIFADKGAVWPAALRAPRFGPDNAA